MNAEQTRLQENKSPDEPWHFWGPYLAERAWGTVREDYSANGDAWNYFPHDQARSRAYRWNEDGLGGISDQKGRLCFGFAFWNERDPFGMPQSCSALLSFSVKKRSSGASQNMLYLPRM